MTFFMVFPFVGLDVTAALKTVKQTNKQLEDFQISQTGTLPAGFWEVPSGEAGVEPPSS